MCVYYIQSCIHVLCSDIVTTLPLHLNPPPSLSLSLALEELGLQDIGSVVVAFPPSQQDEDTIAAMEDVWKVSMTTTSLSCDYS